MISLSLYIYIHMCMHMLLFKLFGKGQMGSALIGRKPDSQSANVEILGLTQASSYLKGLKSPAYEGTPRIS